MAKVFVLFNHGRETEPLWVFFIFLLVRGTCLICLSLQDHIRFGWWWKDQMGPTESFQNVQHSAQGAGRSLEELQTDHCSTHTQKSCSFQYLQLPTMCKDLRATWVAGREFLPVLGGESVWSQHSQCGAQDKTICHWKDWLLKTAFAEGQVTVLNGVWEQSKAGESC